MQDFIKALENLSAEELKIIFSQTKGFTGILGNKNRNKAGLHIIRMMFAKTFSNLKVANSNMKNDGYFLVTDFLDQQSFSNLKLECLKFIKDKNKCFTHCFSNENTTQEVQNFFNSKTLLNLINDCTGYQFDKLQINEQCKLKLQYLVAREFDVETQPHADTFFDTYKYWFFLEDSTVSNGAFRYRPGSHNLTVERLKKEYEISISDNLDVKTKEGSSRYEDVGLHSISAPKNSLLIANTLGVHCRGNISEGQYRLALHGDIRINPFLINLK